MVPFDRSEHVGTMLIILSLRQEKPASYFHDWHLEKNRSLLFWSQKCRLGHVRPHKKQTCWFLMDSTWQTFADGPRFEHRSAMACGPSSRNRSWRTSRWTPEPLSWEGWREGHSWRMDQWFWWKPAKFLGVSIGSSVALAALWMAMAATNICHVWTFHLNTWNILDFCMISCLNIWEWVCLKPRKSQPYSVVHHPF